MKKIFELAFLLLIIGYALYSLIGHFALAYDCHTPLTTSGDFFQSYEQVEYQNGLLVMHFKINPTRANAVQWQSGSDVQNDTCEYGNLFQNPVFKLHLPLGLTDFSVRFSTPTHYDIWNDASGTPLVCGSGETGCTRDLPNYPSYYTFAFKANAQIGSGFHELQSSFRSIRENPPAPPLLSSTFPAPNGCTSLEFGNGYYFDNYEHAEYSTSTDGTSLLLRVHFRFKSPYNDGRAFRLRVRTHAADCSTATSVPTGFANISGLTPYMRYWSVRFSSPTHWQIWNDESNTPEFCAGCAGEVASDTPFVSLAASIDTGSSYLLGTPYLPAKAIVAGHDSVIFIPGIEASRLYTVGDHGVDKLWEPTPNSNDIRQLFLDQYGHSIDPAIYVGKIIDETPEGFIAASNIYKSFAEMMDGLVADHKINEWEALPYDWRLDYNEILAAGTNINGNLIQKMQDEVERLARSSQTHKVTIVAHSHGGLVAKALITRLEAAGEGDIVDQLILVAVPQEGTPEAIASLLHGDSSFGFLAKLVITRPLYRALAEHSQAAFNMLPTPSYFARVIDPVVEFDASSTLPQIATWRALYGPNIHDNGTLRSFLQGSDGRAKPAENEVNSPNVLLPNFLSRAETNAAFQDNWQLPTGLKITQIVGWGLDTLRGIKYSDRVQTVCNQNLSICQPQEVLDERPLTGTDGDKTVISYSADKLATATWYVDLYKYNRSLSVIEPSRDHADILEVPDTLSLLNDYLSGVVGTPGSFVFPQKPVDDNPEHRLSVHSPVSIDVYDSQGRHTGIAPGSDPELQSVDEQIPNSRYFEFGEGKYVSLPQGDSYSVVIAGTGEGTFTLEDEKGTGGSYSAPDVAYQNVPVDASSTAILTLDSAGAISALSLDVDGDGTSDVTVGQGEEISAGSLLDILEYQIAKLDLKAKDIKKFDKTITKVRKALTKQKVENAIKRLDKLQKDIERAVLKNKITHDDAARLIELIMQIKQSIQ